MLQPRHLFGLTCEQQCAVTSKRKRTVVIAGPGAGKTRTLVSRIIQIKSQEPNANILALTFTVSAAREMSDRVKKTLGADKIGGIWIGTFHAWCAMELRNYDGIRDFGITKDFQIAPLPGTKDTANYFLTPLLRNLADTRGWIKPGNPLKPVIEWIEAGEDSYQRPWRNALTKLNYVDYSMIIDYVSRITLTHCYDNILVDEYQDTDGKQIKILNALDNPNLRYFLVGDPRQSIYRWRGAEPEYILSEQDPLYLNTNFRSTKGIVDLLNRLQTLMGYNKPLRANTPGEYPFFEVFPSLNDESYEIIRQIQNCGYKRNEIAILSRTNGRLAAIKKALYEEGIPTDAPDGLWEKSKTPEVQDIITALRWFCDKHHDYLFDRTARIMGVPENEIEALAEKAKCDHVSMWDAWQDERNPLKTCLQQSVNIILHAIDYMITLARGSYDCVRPTFSALLSCFSDNNGSIPDFLSWYDNLEPSDLINDSTKDNHVTVCTVHAAKGREWPFVIFVGWEEGHTPKIKQDQTKDEETEEMNIAFVGCSRAADRLLITRCERNQWGQEAEPSRFLESLLAAASDKKAGAK